MRGSYGRSTCGTLLLVFLVSAASAKPTNSGGFISDLTSVAEGDAHKGYDSGQEAAELWTLGAPEAAGAALARVHSLQQLQREDRTVDAQGTAARLAKEKSKHEGTAISLALNKKLTVLPASEECKCANKNGWAVVTAARAQVLKEEGGASAEEITKAADECPCRSALVSAVTQVLQEKLEKLTQELGSKTSAALALQRALVSMRLPDALAGELTRELDQSLAGKALEKTGVAPAAAAPPAQASAAAPGAATPGAQEKPEAINVIVNNNMGDGIANVTFSDVVNQSLPYFYGYRYPSAYIKGGQAPFNSPQPYKWEGGGGEEGMNVFVNVNNYIMPQNAACVTTRCFLMHAPGLY
jgi:hypothetical protein